MPINKQVSYHLFTDSVLEKENVNKSNSQRGQMVHKTIKPEEQDTLVQLDLTEDEGQLIPE